MNILPLNGQSAGPLFGPAPKAISIRRTNGWKWRAARLARRTPKWAKTWKIEFVYAVAKLRGETVDHIVPINHPLVCGLHVEHNLAVLPLRENLLKGNNWWPDMWGEQERLL